MRRAAIAASAFLMAVFPSVAERSVDFFGVVSRDADGGMVKMTEDLYRAQLGEVDGVSVFDRRSPSFLSSYLDTGEADFSDAKSRLVFYMVINKSAKDGDRWICSMNLADSETGETKSQSKIYDSYYKILMEPKAALQAALKSLLADEDDDVPREGSDDDPGARPASTDALAGTWTGEDLIDKIVILRGGRGFVIFKNGATMNILVSLDGSQVVVAQSGKSNASFFPELPRKVALEMAAGAHPIRWTFSMQGGDTLVGEKDTLVAAGDGAVQGSSRVVWKRRL